MSKSQALAADAAPSVAAGRLASNKSARRVLASVFGYESFRGDQAAIVAQLTQHPARDRVEVNAHGAVRGQHAHLHTAPRRCGRHKTHRLPRARSHSKAGLTASGYSLLTVPSLAANSCWLATIWGLNCSASLMASASVSG